MSHNSDSPRIGARVLLVDSKWRVLLMHACDPTVPGRHWWELPGGGVEEGEDLQSAALRELAEETGYVLNSLDSQLWVYESRFVYKGENHHRIDHVFLGFAISDTPQMAVNRTDNERIGLIGYRWWSPLDLCYCGDKIIPSNFGTIVANIFERLQEAPYYLMDKVPFYLLESDKGDII